ncbi:unnamed protein product [Trichogramma brassicae]|uniref:RNA-directed DNA polymerase n=1 Tax=Trichogramma brassicae TaxID=86971 RepID=A0A6H5HWL6_9HYME|nr:unnamed protein product [Trichogramma brassicae]
MRKSNTVGDFYDYLNLLLSGAQHALEEEKGNAYNASMMTPLKDLVVDIFIRGLPPDMSTAVDSRNPTSLDEAYAEAKRIETRRNAHILPDNRYRSDYNNYNNRYQNNDRQSYPREHVGIMRPSEVPSRQENLQHQGYNSQPQRNQYSYDNSQYRQNQDRHDHQQYHRNNQYSPRNQGPQNYNPRGYNHNYQSGNRNYNQSPRNEQYANHRENPDASDYAIGAVLSQTVDGNDLPVSYLSRSLNKHEINYTTTEKECLAALYAMSIYRPYLLGRKFTLQSDHEPLNWMHSRKDPGQRLMRWMFKFSDYDYDFKYKPGKENVVADGLSRNPPERDLNQNLPNLKVMMLRTKPKSTPPQKPTDQNTADAKEKPKSSLKRSKSLPSSKLEAPKMPKPKLGRPPGAPNKKYTVDPNESCVAKRTRGQTKIDEQRTIAKTTPPITSQQRLKSGVRSSMPPKASPKPILNRIVRPLTPQPLGSQSETDTDSEVPRDDPRTSALREQDTEDSSVEAETRVHQDASSDAESESSLAQEPLDSEIELELTSAATSVDEPLEDDVFESELDTTLTDAEISQARENVAKSLRRSFEAEDVPSRVNLRSIINDSRTSLTDEEDIDKETRETLKELDPYDAETGRDDEMEKRIQQLVEASSDILSSEQGGSSDDSSSAETTIDRDEFFATNTGTSKTRRFKNTTSIIGRPRAVSTPAVVAQTTRPRLSSIPENPSIQLNFSRPPLDNTLSDQIIPIAIPNLNPIYNENTIDYAQENCSNTRQNRVTLSREGLTYVNDHIAHFIYADANTNDNVGKLLQDIGAIDLKNIKSKHPNVGQVLTTKFKNRNIFTVIVLQKHYENLSVEALEKGINNLKRVCKRKGVNSLRIARNCSTTNNLPPGALAQTLSQIFTNPNTSITLCYGNTSAVPEHERLRIIQLLHSSPFGGHKGITQTYRKIRERFYWRNMRDDITEFINNCAGCQENKITRAKTRNPMIITDTPIESFDKVSIDTVGKLRTTTTGNCHILTMQCHLTKYLLAIPLPNIKATTIANALARNLICQFGAPRAILSDRGRPRQMFQNSRFLQLRTYNARRNKQKYRRMRSKYMDK